MGSIWDQNNGEEAAATGGLAGMARMTGKTGQNKSSYSKNQSNMPPVSEDSASAFSKSRTAYKPEAGSLADLVQQKQELPKYSPGKGGLDDYANRFKFTQSLFDGPGTELVNANRAGGTGSTYSSRVGGAYGIAPEPPKNTTTFGKTIAGGIEKASDLTDGVVSGAKKITSAGGRLVDTSLPAMKTAGRFVGNVAATARPIAGAAGWVAEAGDVLSGLYKAGGTQEGRDATAEYFSHAPTAENSRKYTDAANAGMYKQFNDPHTSRATHGLNVAAGTIGEMGHVYDKNVQELGQKIGGGIYDVQQKLKGETQSEIDGLNRFAHGVANAPRDAYNWAFGDRNPSAKPTQEIPKSDVPAAQAKIQEQQRSSGLNYGLDSPYVSLSNNDGGLHSANPDRAPYKPNLEGGALTQGEFNRDNISKATGTGGTSPKQFELPKPQMDRELTHKEAHLTEVAKALPQGSAEQKAILKSLTSHITENDHYAQQHQSRNDAGNTTGLVQSFGDTVGQQVTGMQKALRDSPDRSDLKGALSDFYNNATKMEQRNAYANAHPDAPEGLVSKPEPPMYSTGYGGEKIMNPDYVSWSNDKAKGRNEPTMLEMDNAGRVTSIRNPEFRDPKTGRNDREEYAYQQSPEAASRRLRGEFERKITQSLASGNYQAAAALTEAYNKIDTNERTERTASMQHAIGEGNDKRADAYNYAKLSQESQDKDKGLTSAEKVAEIGATNTLAGMALTQAQADEKARVAADKEAHQNDRERIKYHNTLSESYKGGVNSGKGKNDFKVAPEESNAVVKGLYDSKLPLDTMSQADYNYHADMFAKERAMASDKYEKPGVYYPEMAPAIQMAIDDPSKADAAKSALDEYRAWMSTEDGIKTPDDLRAKIISELMKKVGNK